jgi:myo-inositol-hexaphosphate 3-phosphohydrolase
MHVHIAIFKWNADADAAAVKKALEEVKALEDKVPGLAGIYVGENTSQWAQGFTHGVVVLGEDEAAIDRYRKHSDHVAVAADIEALEQDGIGVDFASK